METHFPDDMRRAINKRRRVHAAETMLHLTVEELREVRASLLHGYQAVMQRIAEITKRHSTPKGGDPV